ncbi:cytochrome c oxidase subunit 3 [Thioclava pacifica]|uniref:Cytochrome bo(3) ubiquinol oxidase subunit 3 n=1 Tax=Thioclava pacifica DSM 10166 TaxID=1353537 RepID=A0A074J3F1_9RHOB|nr:cytochrome c oxidase subunit 3 [Thioclava pacifica]KEO51976.1 hypothetical protein TP2_10900 [Thioclava pacifica DSM 10166]
MSATMTNTGAAGHTASHDHGHHDKTGTVIFGFWIFLMSDLIAFSLMIANYADAEWHGIANGPSPHELFSLGLPTIETMALLISTFTFGICTLGMKYGASMKRTIGWLVLTLALGAIFLGIELYEFHEFWTDGNTPQVSGFLTAYYSLVGLHGLHVTSGIIWGIILMVQMKHFGMNDLLKSRLVRLGLFWHMLDIVWIALFTKVYLMGVLS